MMPSLRISADSILSASDEHSLLRPLRKYPGEVLAMRIEDNQPQNCYNDCQRYAGWIQEHVIEQDVHNHWSKKHKAKRHIPVHKQQRATRDLQRSDYPKIMRHCECADKLPCQS